MGRGVEIKSPISNKSPNPYVSVFRITEVKPNNRTVLYSVIICRLIEIVCNKSFCS